MYCSLFTLWSSAAFSLQRLFLIHGNNHRKVHKQSESDLHTYWELSQMAGVAFPVLKCVIGVCRSF